MADRRKTAICLTSFIGSDDHKTDISINFYDEDINVRKQTSVEEQVKYRQHNTTPPLPSHPRHYSHYPSPVASPGRGPDRINSAPFTKTLRHK